MERDEAYKLLAHRLNQLRVSGYAALVKHIGTSPMAEAATLDGEVIEIEIDFVWAEREGGDLRVSATAYGPSTWRLERLEESFVIGPADSR